MASQAAQAAVVLTADAQTFTGANFLVAVEPSDPGAVVLVEWDFDGDGHVDANRTSDFRAQHRYLATGDFDVRVYVTREDTPGLVVEQANWSVHVVSGSPTANITVPGRVVAGVPQVFRAVVSDPDASPAGEQFRYAWTVDGEAVASAGPNATIEVSAPGTHVVRLQATDEEGITAFAEVTVDFGSPGVLEGTQGTVNLSLMVGAVAFAVGLALVRSARRDRRAATVRTEGEAARIAQGLSAPSGPAKPLKVPFEAASAPPSGARVVVGGTPAALARTKECPVCHNAIDADLDPASCPFCLANAQAEALEATLAEPAYEGIDLSEVRALLQRARRERHLGRGDVHAQLLGQARERAGALLEERGKADEWLDRARRAVEGATSKTDAERLDRAHSYLKLAESLSKAHQHGKVLRHAKRCVEILSEGGAGMDTPDRCHACGGAVAAARAAGAQRCPHCDAALLPEAPEAAVDGEAHERQVRDELHAVRAMLTAGTAAPDEEAWALLREAEAFEKDAAWAQALELLRALRERFERERDAAAGPDVADQGPGGAPQGDG
jgi:hypothetical protein